MQSRRIGFLVFLAGLFCLLLVYRLYYFSVSQHSHYVALANQQQNVVQAVLPQRGSIYVQDYSTRTPDLLTESQQFYAISATPKNVTNKVAYAQVLAKFCGVDEGQLLAQLETDSLYMPPIQHGFSKTQIEDLANQLNVIEKSANSNWVNEAVNFDAPQGNVIYFIGGVFFIPEFERVYPQGTLLAHALGFVDDAGNGKYGIEGEYNTLLKGYSGEISMAQDSLGTLLGQTTLVSGQNGDSYILTVDRNVQYEVEQQLNAEVKLTGAQGGTVIVMDPKTGGIIAMASTPSYDPSQVRNMTSSQVSLFDNPAISQIWEPGSIFKPFVMAAALDTGVVTPDTKNTFGESVTVQGHVIQTALRYSYGEETMSQIIQKSDNVGMVWVSNQLGNQSMYKYLTSFGFGSPTGVDLQNEIAGELMSVSQWQDIDRATMSFGQGIAVTPMQIITGYSAFANNGRLVLPHIVQTVISPDGKVTNEPTTEEAQVVKPQTAQEILSMLQATVQYEHNEATTPGYLIGGKTGTAQVPDPVNGGYLPDAYNHSFVGIGPINNPRYVVLVKLDQPDLKKAGLYAEGTALPLFQRISTFLLNYYQIKPTTKP
jgi:cell division protein FtsI/penicillin-binding protein 2